MATLNPAQFADYYKPLFGLPYCAPLKREVLEKFSDERLRKYAEARKIAEDAQISNPTGGGWTLPMWQKVMGNWGRYKNHVILGGNRSGKTTLTSRFAVWTSCTIPGAEVHLYQVNKEKSISEQQRYVWDAIPVSIKQMPTKKGQNHSIQFSQKNAFTDDICIFPPHSGARRGGYMKFHNYAQYADDPSTAESYKAHLIVLDEECPLDLFKTLQYRTIDYRGRIMLGFTTILGWSPLVQAILARTKTIEKRFAPLVGRELPTIQESLSFPDTCIYYCWTEDNVFIDGNDFRKGIIGKPKEEILARAYGIPTKSISGVFSAFDKEVNVIPHDHLPWIKNKAYKVTRYMAIDPAGRKNWFMVWVAIDAAGTWWVYDEWPDYDKWAEPGSTAEGKAGPAQAGSKKGIKDYVELIRNKEGDDRIFERYIDPRLGAAEKQSVEGATTIISDLDDCDMTVIPAPGVEIENGLQLIQNLLAWDDSKKRDSMNAPRFYVSERCENIIFAMAEYTGKGGVSEAVKDPIDCLRYIAVSNPEFYEEKGDGDHPTGVY